MKYVNRSLRGTPPRPSLFSKLICLLLVLIVSEPTFAQSSSGSDGYITVKYLGYSNGKYAIQVVNKQTGCNPDIKFTWDDDTKITAITPDSKNNAHFGTVTGASTIFYFTGTLNTHAIFKVTDQTICQWMGSNPEAIVISVAVFTPTPITFKGPARLEWQNEDHTKLKVSFDIATISGINEIHYQVRKVNGEWKTVSIQFPTNAHAGETYSTIITL